LPAFLPQLLISAEDEGFYTHPGVDIKGIVRAVYLNFKEGKVVSGGSTITQQVAHDILFSEGTGRKTLYQKAVESLFAVVLDSIWSKDRILYEYFNRMYFGRLAYGIEAASQRYFAKTASDLDLAEGSALLALLHLPGISEPENNLDLLKSRQKYVLDRGVEAGALVLNEANLAYLETLHFTSAFSENLASQCLRQYLSNEVQEILNLSSNAAGTLLGLTIETTLDQSFLLESGRILTENLKEIAIDYEVNNASAVSINPVTGEILGYTCNVSVSEKDTDVDLIQSLRQPGSAIKPVTYLKALDEGFTLSSPLHDSLQVFYTHDGKVYVPEDYDQRQRGLVTLRESLASSLNIPAVELLDKIGLDNFFATAKVLGINSFSDTYRYDLAITLGGGEVTLLELTSVYAALANELARVEPYAIKKIFQNDKVIYEHQPSREEKVLGVFSKQLSYLIADVLSDNRARRFAFPEINPLVTSQKTAAKTGTTQDFRDSWALGYTPKIAVGVWAGNADQSPMLGLSGAQGAAPIWNDLMEMYLRNGYAGWFDEPEGIYHQDVCLNANCSDIKSELFLAGTEPRDNEVFQEEQKFAGNQEVEIVYPYNGQIFQINNRDDLSEFEKIIFRAEVLSPDTVEWFLNGQSLGSSGTVDRTAKFVWSPQAGKCQLKVANWRGDSDMVDFEVVARS